MEMVSAKLSTYVSCLQMRVFQTSDVTLGSFPTKLLLLPVSSDYIIIHLGCQVLRTHLGPTPYRDSRCTFPLRGSAQDCPILGDSLNSLDSHRPLLTERTILLIVVCICAEETNSSNVPKPW